MAKRRVKVKVEPVKIIVEQPKVRPVVKKPIKKTETEIKTVERKAPSDNRFERRKDGDLSKRNEINEKVKQGLLKWAFYGIDNEIGYQYYLKIKK